MSKELLDLYQKDEGPIVGTTDFSPGSVYSYTVTRESGLTVYSECCSDTVDLTSAKILHEALGQWITEREAES